MRFLIKGDQKKISAALEEFCGVADKEWSNVAQKSDTIMTKFVKMTGAISPVKPLEMPESIAFVHYENGKDVVFVVNIYLPKLIKAVAGLMKKKLIKGLEDFFKSKDIKVKIEFMGWE